MDLRDLVAQTAEAAFAVDAAQRIIAWNAAAEALMGVPASEALGRPCHEILAGRDRAGNLVCCAGCPAVTTVARGELVRGYELLVRTRDGRQRWIAVATIVLRPQREQEVAAIHLMRDVSGQRHSQALLEHLLAGGVTLVPVDGRQEDPGTPVDPLAALTAREREVLEALATGAGTREIAARLYLSPATVRTHVQRVLHKLGVHSRLEAVTVASGGRGRGSRPPRGV
ncbi:MAG: PAS domain-containing protein [Armatimonadetes bacterium]|nr:PAS domain-containing protein [Armatimonadota bacterium]